MSSRWWRAYDEAVDDPKLHFLTDKQHRNWFNLCCITSQNGGTLPPIDAIAFKLRTTPEKAKHIVAELSALKLVDVSDDGSATMHNWPVRQFQSDVSTERVKRFRERQRNVSETANETDQRQSTDSERKKRSLRSLDLFPSDSSSATALKKQARSELVSRAKCAQFEEFWARYPNKIGKKTAAKSFETIKKTGIDIAILMAGLERYIAKTDDRPWCNPATWLNQGRWEDQPAQVQNGSGRSVLAAADRAIEHFRQQGATGNYVPGSSGPKPLGVDSQIRSASPKLISSR